MDCKVFGIGFHRTGTTSLAQALTRLGYKTIHGDGRRLGGDEGRTFIHQFTHGDYRMRTLTQYDAFTDNPYFTIWQQLYWMYPEAKYILTIRDAESWIRSCKRLYPGRRIRPMREWMFGEHASLETRESETVWRKRFDAHNESVRAFFYGKPNFLEMRLGDGYEKLCPFLEKDVLQEDYPHANKGQK
jgi:hypothetical protein